MSLKKYITESIDRLIAEDKSQEDYVAERRAASEERLAKIMEQINKGNIVSFTTYTRSTPVDKKVIENFKKAGYDFFSIDGAGHLCMMQGKKTVATTGCKITVFTPVPAETAKVSKKKA